MSVEFPVQSIDFDQIQIQIQLEDLTPENLLPYQRSESARIKSKLSEAKALGLDLGRKAVVIVDGTVDLMPSAQIRKLQGEWLKENASLLGLVVHSMGFVVPSATARGALTAVMWLAPMPFKVTTHATLEQALDWAITEVDQMHGKISNELLLGGVMAIEKRRLQAEGAHSKWATRRLQNASGVGA